MKAPNKYSKNFQHRNFGIENWFRSKGLTNTDKQKEIIESFLADKSFIPPVGGKKVISNSKTAFVQNRFAEFASYAINKIREI